MAVSYTKYIVVLIIIYGIIYSYQLGKSITASTKNLSSSDMKDRKSSIDFNKQKCYPHMIFLAGFFEDAEGDDFISKTINNFNTCIFSKIEKFIKENARPLLFIITFIKDGIAAIGIILNSFRKMAIFLRKMFMALVQSTTDKLKNSYSAVLYLQEKMRLIINKQSALFEVLNQLVATLPFLLHSFMYGPVVRLGVWMASYTGFLIAMIVICLLCVANIFIVSWPACAICAICFTGDTEIDMPDNKTKLIKDIKPGEKIKNDIVKGKIYIKKHNADTYDYKGINVTGSHLVFDNKWMRVEDSSNAVSNRIFTDLYCLITDKNTIHSNGIKFRDYQETQDIDINLKINYLIASSLNNNIGCIRNIEDRYHNYYWGFHKNTNIIIDNKSVKVSEIVNNPNDYNVKGVIEIHSPYILYNYDGIMVSGNTLVNEKGIWLRVHQSTKSIKLSDETILYNIITEDNIIEADGLTDKVYFRDFEETSDIKVNDKIDKLVEDRLNLIFDFDK